MEKKGMINYYTCETCGKSIVTVNAADGVTPAFIGCRFGCDAMMHSHWYHVPQHTNPLTKNQYEWYKPEDLTALRPEEREHVELGGLLLRRRFTIADAFRGNCACGRWLIIAPSVPESDPLTCECGRKYYAERGDDQVVYQCIDIEEATP